MNDEMTVSVFLIAIAAAAVLVFRVQSWKSALTLCVIATVLWTALFWMVFRAPAADQPTADQLKAYCFGDRYGYVIVTDKDLTDAKQFGQKAAAAAAEYSKRSGNPLVPTKLKAFCEAEGVKRYPDNRRIADWFAAQSEKAFITEYEKRTAKRD
jgi:hypothetical protein